MEAKENFQKFRDDSFLALNTLNEKSAMEYFYLSQFFDRHSLNQKRRRGLPVESKSEGIEFRLIYRNVAAKGQVATAPGCQWNFPNQFGAFVIQKYNRDSKGTETPLECYYILGGTIFKAPSLGDLVRQRVLDAAKRLELVLSELYSISSWSLIEGFNWGQPANDDDASDKEEDIILQNAVEIGTERSHSNEESGKDSIVNSSELQDATDANNTQMVHATEDSSDTSIKRQRQEIDDNDNTTALNWVAVNDLYTKRPCTDANRVIEETFAALASAGLRFNANVDKIRDGWQKMDKEWQEQQLARLEAT